MKTQNTFVQLSLFNDTEYDLQSHELEKEDLRSRLLGKLRERALLEIFCRVDSSIAEEFRSCCLISEVESEEGAHGDGQRLRKLVIRALVPNDWDAIRQQLFKYGDKMEVITPLELREKICQEGKYIYERYSL